MYNPNTIYRELLPQLEKLEELRKETLGKDRRAMKTCAVMAGGVLILAALMGTVAVKVGLITGALGLAGVIKFYNMIVDDEKSKFKLTYKNRVIKAIVQKIEPRLTYTISDGVCLSVFCKAGHYATRVDRYHAEDHFEGQFGATTISFSEVHAEREVKNNNRSSWETIFKGVMFKADFHKEFGTWVTVRPDNEVGLFGWIGKKVQSVNNTLVRMEDQVFEQHFQVNAGDDKEARYILTPDMQQRLLEVRKNYGKNVIISFQQGVVYLTIPKSENWFESSLKVSALSEKQVQRIAAEIQYFLQLVEDLDLNTRIWTKV